MPISISHRALAACALLGPMLSAAATTFEVTTTADLPAANPGDGICEASSGAGNCSLRAAIMEANSIGTPVEIILPAGDYLLSLGQLQADGQITIRGAGAELTRIDANSLSRVINNLDALSLHDLTIRGGRSLDTGNLRGGGLFNQSNMILRRVIIEDNVANIGGGVATVGTLLVEDSSFRNNDLQFASPQPAAFGGAAIQGQSADITIVRSSFHANLANPDAVGFVGTIRSVGGQLRIINATVSGNGRGGVNVENGALDLRFSSLLDHPGGNLLNFSFDASHTTVLAANVFKNNLSFNCSGTAAARTSLGYNVAGDSGCDLVAVGDLQNTDPRLGPLSDNGGPSLSHAPRADSPAIRRVPLPACTDFGAAPLATDQRGRSRPVGGACDSGSVEFDPAAELIFSDRFEP